jgi:hypothetical protein
MRRFNFVLSGQWQSARPAWQWHQKKPRAVRTRQRVSAAGLLRENIDWILV